MFTSLKLIPGLEEIQLQVEDSIASDVPTVDQVVSDTSELNKQAEDIDLDLSALQSSAQALENIITLVEGTPTAADAPLDDNVRSAVGIALEANDAAAMAGNQVALTGDKGQTKKDFLTGMKDFAKKVWAALVGMGKKILEWIKGAWANATDRLVKNTNKAKALKASLSQINSRPGAKIESEGVLKAVANAKGDDVGNILLSVFDYAKLQGDKAAKQITHEAALLVEAVSSGRSDNAALLNKFLDLLQDGAGAFHDKATPAQAQAAKAPAGAQVLVSDPFFGGNRAWLVAPENAEALALWNHGLSQLDEPKPIDASAPDVKELEVIIDYLITGQDIVGMYKARLGELDEIQKKMEAASRKPGDNVDRKQLSQLQAVIPRIIKGPQVTAFNYAGTASSIALSYVQAAVAAHSAKPAEKAQA